MFHIYLLKNFNCIYLIIRYIILFKNLQIGIGDWGLGIGDWGLGIGGWAQSPIPNPHFINFNSFLKLFRKY